MAIQKNASVEWPLRRSATISAALIAASDKNETASPSPSVSDQKSPRLVPSALAAYIANQYQRVGASARVSGHRMTPRGAVAELDIASWPPTKTLTPRG